MKATPLNANEKSRRRIHLREISGDHETASGTVGQELREARLRRGDDLATVSRALKIRKDHLEAVEEDRLENLPGKTYALGFVRTYATHLGLDTAEIVERYKREISDRHDDHMPTVSPMPDEQRRLPQGWRFVAGVVVLAVGYGVWHLISAGAAPQSVPPAPSLAPPKPAAPAPAPPPAPTPEQTATPSPAIETAPPADNTAPAQPSPPASSGDPAAAPGQTAAIPSPAAGAAPSPASAGTVYGTNNHNARVVLKAKADTHVMVRGQDGMVYINRNLKAGDSYKLPSAPGLTLSASNAGAVEVNLDGQAMGLAGADQQSADNVPLDPQAIADRFRH